MKQYLEKIDFTNQEHKNKVIDIMDMLLCSVKDTDYQLYDFVKSEMYELIYGRKLSEEMVDKWVHDLKPMAKWTREDIKNVINTYGLTICENDAYVLFNMMYSDYKNVLGDTEESLEKYIELVKDFYYDEDIKISGQEKLYLYYKNIYKAKEI